MSFIASGSTTPRPRAQVEAITRDSAGTAEAPIEGIAHAAPAPRGLRIVDDPMPAGVAQVIRK